MSALKNSLSPLDAIKHICNIRQSIFGLEYLQELLGRFAELYDLEYALIGRPRNQPNTVIETELLLSQGNLQDNITYSLAGTPCENVVDGERICMYRDGVCAAFPEDILLQEMGVNSYIGSKLLSPEGKLLGILVFMSAGQIKADDSIFTVLDFVASRAGMELEREDLNYQLKVKAEEENREKRLAALGQLVNGVAHDFNDKMDSLCQSFGIIVPRIIFGMKESIQCSVRPLVLISQSLFSKFPLQTEIKKS